MIYYFGQLIQQLVINFLNIIIDIYIFHVVPIFGQIIEFFILVINQIFSNDLLYNKMSCGGNGNSTYVQQILNRCSISNGKNLVNNFNRITNLENSDIGPAGPPDTRPQGPQGPQGSPGVDGQDVTAKKYLTQFDITELESNYGIPTVNLFKFNSGYSSDIIINWTKLPFILNNTINTTFDNTVIILKFLLFIMYGIVLLLLSITQPPLSYTTLVTLQTNEYVKMSYVYNGST